MGLHVCCQYVSDHHWSLTGIWSVLWRQHVTAVTAMWCCAAVFDGDNVFLHGADRIAHGLEQETGSKWRGSYFMPAQADRWRSHMPSHGLRHGWHSHRSVIRRTGALTLLAHCIPAVRQILQVSAGCILHADADSALPELTLLWAWPC